MSQIVGFLVRIQIGLKTLFFGVAQNKIIPVKNIFSTTTNRLHKSIVAAGLTYVNDQFSNVVCVITCNKCKFQYVEESSQNPNKRFSSHNCCCRNPTWYSFCKILSTHFSNDYCKYSSYTANIIENLDEDTMNLQLN